MNKKWVFVVAISCVMALAALSFGGQPRNPRPEKADQVYQNDKDLWDSLNKMRLLSEYTPATLSSSQNNYSVSNFSILRLSSDSSWDITGVQGGEQGRWIILMNVGGNNIVLDHQSASSTAANRIISNTGANYTLFPSSSTFMYYDSTTARWRILFN